VTGPPDHEQWLQTEPHRGHRLGRNAPKDSRRSFTENSSWAVPSCGASGVSRTECAGAHYAGLLLGAVS